MKSGSNFEEHLETSLSFLRNRQVFWSSLITDKILFLFLRYSLLAYYSRNYTYLDLLEGFVGEFKFPIFVFASYVVLA